MLLYPISTKPVNWKARYGGEKMAMICINMRIISMNLVRLCLLQRHYCLKHERHHLLYITAVREYSWPQFLQAISELQQILQTEVSSARSRKDERIGSHQISPAGRQKAHASVLVA